jgi:hypothetical protein
MNPSNQDRTLAQHAAAHPPVVHLTDAQFTDLLLGTIPPAVSAHLESCPHCAEEAQRVSGAIGSFAQQSRQWAERRVAARPAQTSARSVSLAWLRAPIPPVAWIAATFLLVAGLGLAHRAHHRVLPPQTVAAVHPAPAVVAPATLKADNELLSAIDGELSDTDLSGAQTYSLNANRQSTRAHSTKGISN